MKSWLQLGILVSVVGLGAALVNDIPPLPQAVPTPPSKKVFHFAATATDNFGLESDYSTELIWTNSITNVSRLIKLGWDAPVCTNVITNYRVYQGRQPGNYTNLVEAGTNLTAWIRILPAIKSNCIVTFSASCTNWASFTLTNPGLALYVRGVPIKGPMAYTIHSEAANSVDGPWASFSAIWPDWTTTVIPDLKVKVEKRYE